MSPYRTRTELTLGQTSKYLEMALSRMRGVYQFFLIDPVNYSILESILPAQAKMLRANCGAYLEMADAKLAGDDCASATIHAESALSTIHDAIEGLVDAVSVRKDG